MQHVTVLGAGGWGTALAVHLGRIGHEVSLWARDPALVADIAARRANAVYLPDVSLPESVTVTASLAEALGDSELVVSALPSHGCRAVMRVGGSPHRAARDRRQRHEGSRDRHAAADVGSDRAGARHGASGGRAVGSELRGRGGARNVRRRSLPRRRRRRPPAWSRKSSAGRTFVCTDRRTSSASRSAAP